MFTRQALHKRLHIEAIVQTRLLLVTSRRLQKLLVRVEQTGEAPDKSCTNLFRVERGRTHNADLQSTLVVHNGLAGAAFVHSFLGPVIADRADGLVIPRLDLQAMSLHPTRAFRVVDRRRRGRRDNRGCSNGRLRIHGWRIGRPRVIIGVQSRDGQVRRVTQERRAGTSGDARLHIHAERGAPPGRRIKVTGSLFPQGCLKSQT